MVRPEKFDEFCLILGRKREFQACVASEDYKTWRKWEPWRTKPELRGKGEILLIEDADIECIMSLDAEVNLDPLFILSYMDYYKLSEEPLLPWEERYHRTDTGIAGSWYVPPCVIQGFHSLDSPRRARQRVPTFWGCAEATNAKRPWWTEACRQSSPAPYSLPRIKSRIACYCMSGHRRKLRP
jgi:hypothetical protein